MSDSQKPKGKEQAVRIFNYKAEIARKRQELRRQIADYGLEHPESTYIEIGRLFGVSKNAVWKAMRCAQLHRVSGCRRYHTHYQMRIARQNTPQPADQPVQQPDSADAQASGVGA
jgi:hypothetical protein